MKKQFFLMPDKSNMLITKSTKIFFNEINEIKRVREDHCHHPLELAFANDFVVSIHTIFYSVAYESPRNTCVVCAAKFF